MSLHYREPRAAIWKPKGYEDWVTLGELSRIVVKDKRWIRRLEENERIPRAKRVQHGEIEVRLWSPKQVEEIKTIFTNMKRGRPFA